MKQVISANNQLTSKECLTPVQRIRNEVRINPDGGTDKQYSVSLYSSKPATEEELASVIIRIGSIYPNMGDGFLAELARRMMANEFTLERASDALNWVEDNVKFRTLAIADIIAYDKIIKLYTYDECVKMINKGICSFEDDLKIYSYKPVTLWYRVSEAIKMGLPPTDKLLNGLPPLSMKSDESSFKNKNKEVVTKIKDAVEKTFNQQQN